MAYIKEYSPLNQNLEEDFTSFLEKRAGQLTEALDLDLPYSQVCYNNGYLSAIGISTSLIANLHKAGYLNTGDGLNGFGLVDIILTVLEKRNKFPPRSGISKDPEYIRGEQEFYEEAKRFFQ